MIIRYYNGYIGYEELKELTKITKDGTTAFHLIEAAKQIGFKAMGVQCTLDNINSENIVLPCIANVIMNNSYRHFVVIYEINYKKGYLVIGDPSNKVIKMSFDIFKSIFSGVLIILYPEQVLPIKGENKISILMLWNILKLHTPLLFQIIIMSSLVAIFSIVSSFYVETMINGINETNSISYLFFLFLIFTVIYLMKIISNFLRDKILVLLTQKLDLILTMDTFKKVLLLPYNYYRNRTTGDIISRIQDLTSIKGIIGQFLVTIAVDLPLSLIAFAVLYIINNQLCGIVIIMAGLYFLIMIIFQSMFEHCINKEQQSRANTNSYMVEAISGFESVKGLKMESKILDNFEKKYVKYLKLTSHHQELYITQSMLKELVYYLGFLVITLIGSWYVIDNKMSLGSLLTFHSLLFYFLDPIQSMINLNHEWKEVKNALRRVLEMQIKNNNSTGFLDISMTGDIEFRNVNYSFNDRDKVLNNISFTIKQNEKLMIVGRSGGGKSTLLKLLMKYYAVPRDNIFINNIDINDYLDSKNVYYINQQETLFTGSILQNIVGNSDVDNETVLGIAKICAVNDIVKNSSLGFNELVEENGFNFSGGERQRIILARALINPFNILIIDEGTNQIDIDLERKILKAIFKKFHDKTIIVISHRLDNLDLFNHMIEIENGKLVKDVKYNEKN